MIVVLQLGWVLIEAISERSGTIQRSEAQNSKCLNMEGTE